MNIYLCYGYIPYTTAVYYERALESEHTVVYVGPPAGPRSGFAPNTDLTQLVKDGFPRPDLILLIEPSLRFFPRGLDRLECPTAVYLIDVHRHLGLREAYAPFFDYLFIAQRDYVPHFQRLGYSQVHWLPLACDPAIHFQERSTLRWDVGFVGSLNSSARARRLALLSKLFAVNDYQAAYPKEAIGEIYSQSKIVFNSSIGGDLNMRVFEALASGTLLVTDRIGNGQGELFRDRVHLVEYQDDEDLVSQVRYYLGHADEREHIARAGQELALAQHTYAHRAQFVLDTIFGQSGGPQLSARIRQDGEASARAKYASLYAYLGFIDALLEELDWSWQQRHNYLSVLALTVAAYARTLLRIARHPKED